MITSMKGLPQLSIFLTYSQSTCWLHALIAIVKYLENHDASYSWTQRLSNAVLSENLLEIVFEIAFEGCLRHDTHPLQHALVFSVITLSRFENHITPLLLILTRSTSLSNVLEHLTDSETMEWGFHQDAELIASLRSFAKGLRDRIQPSICPELEELYQRIIYALWRLVQITS